MKKILPHIPKKFKKQWFLGGDIHYLFHVHFVTTHKHLANSIFSVNGVNIKELGYTLPNEHPYALGQEFCEMATKDQDVDDFYGCG